MKKLSTFLIVILFSTAMHSQVGIGTTNPDASSVLDLTSTTQGFLMPRMTTTERDAITTPAVGLQVYDITTSSMWYYDGTTWIESGSGTGGSLDNIYTTDGTLEQNRRVFLNDKSLAFEGATNTDAFILIRGADLGSGGESGAIYLGNVRHGFQRGYPNLGENNDIGIFTAGASPNIYLSADDKRTDMFVLQSDGNVGIGTGIPSVTLEVSASVGESVVDIRNSDMGDNINRLRVRRGSRNEWMEIEGPAGIPQTGVIGLRMNGAANPYTGALYFRDNGNIGVNQENPVAMLDINGVIKISGGAPAADKVLTSDANGVASWETPVADGLQNGTWQNNSKVFNTNYTNSTGRSKYVSCSGDGSLAYMALQINGEPVDNQDTQDGGSRRINVGGIVPPGATFNCTSTGSAQTNTSFLEMTL